MVLFSRLATCRNLLALLVRRTVLGLWYLDRVKSLLIALILDYCTDIFVVSKGSKSELSFLLLVRHRWRSRTATVNLRNVLGHVLHVSCISTDISEMRETRDKTRKNKEESLKWNFRRQLHKTIQPPHKSIPRTNELLGFCSIHKMITI